MKKPELPVLTFASQKAWEKWLGAQPADAAGVWLKLPKKTASDPSALSGKVCSGFPPGKRAGILNRRIFERKTATTLLLKMRSVTKPEAIESALAHGWIDGQIGAFDTAWFLTRFTPRKKQSRWSKNNCATAERLIRDGRMKPRGLREVERAKEDGRWKAAYAGQAKATVPKDLQAALNASPKAKAFFATLNSVNRYAILYRVGAAKKAETRAARIEKFIAMLERGERIHEK